MRITVVGAGIIGLTAAWRLREAKHQVRVVSDLPPERTTSAIAAALWLPYLVQPEDVALRWSARSLPVLRSLAEQPGTGVHLRRGRELHRTRTPDPSWMSLVDGARHVPGTALPAGFEDAIELTVPLIDMSVHLPWLAERAASEGVEFVSRHVTDLSELEGDVVVNCTGLASRELCCDEAMAPVRGQVVLVEQSGIDEWFVEHTDPEHPTYVIPRENTVVCGGTALSGIEDTDPDPLVAQRILRDCATLEPRLRTNAVVRHVVGLRPSRTRLRMEWEGRVLHCYGHGGGGVTLAYGCAEEIADRVRSL